MDLKMTEEQKMRFDRIAALCEQFRRAAPLCRVFPHERREGGTPGADVTLVLPLPMCMVSAGPRRNFEECMETADAVFFAHSDAGLCVSFCVSAQAMG